MNFKNIFNKKIIIAVFLTTAVWIIIFLIMLFILNKKKIIKTENNLISKSISNLTPTLTPNWLLNPEDVYGPKLFEKENISIYESDSLHDHEISLHLIDKNKEKREIITRNVFALYDNREICETNSPNIISYNSGDLGILAKIFINTETRESIQVDSVFSSVTIEDDFRDYFTSKIEVSINDQCDSQNRAYVKDLLLNSYPQNIFPKEYEIKCPKGGLGDYLTKFDFNGINRELTKIFFTYKTTKIDNSEIEHFYSYDLVKHKIQLEKPNDLLIDNNCQYLEQDSSTNNLIFKINSNSILN